MGKSHSLNSLMVVSSLEVDKNPFHPKEENKEVQYLSTFSALMYLANCTKLDITFSINFLARYSSAQL